MKKHFYISLITIVCCIITTETLLSNSNSAVISNKTVIESSHSDSTIKWLEVPYKARYYIYDNYKGSHILEYKSVLTRDNDKLFEIKLNHNGDIYHLKFNAKGDLTRMKLEKEDNKESEQMISHSLK